MILLRFLLIAVSILWLLRILARFLLPVLFQSLVKKAAQQQTGQQYRQQKPNKPEGSLHVDFVPPKDKEARAADRAGEFIDYEEIK